MLSPCSPSDRFAATSPVGGGRNASVFVFPPRGKWLSVSETDGGPAPREPRLTKERARRLRRTMTNAEVKLWVHLRKRDLCGHRFRRQHPVGPYIADFACFAAKLIVEVDGATHGSAQERRHDAVRTAYLEAQGWTVIRFWNVDVYQHLSGVLDAIAEAAGNLMRERAKAGPPPSAARTPPPLGEDERVESIKEVTRQGRRMRDD